MTFETFLTLDRPRSDRWRRITYALSLALHGTLLVVGVAASFWRVEELTPPRIPIVFTPFATPPPPPPALGSRRVTTARTRTRAALVQPRPAEAPAPSQSEPSREAEEGPPGVETGSETSDCIGEHCTGVAPGPTQFVPPQVARGRLAIDPQDERYRVRLPAAMASAGMTVWALLKICVKPDGRISEVKVLKSADPVLDPTIVAVLSTWHYLPYTLDGRPVPFCTTLRYEITAR